MERYSMLVTNGGCREIESDNGEWVKYEDVQELLDLCARFVDYTDRTETLTAE